MANFPMETFLQMKMAANPQKDWSMVLSDILKGESEKKAGIAKTQEDVTGNKVGELIKLGGLAEPGQPIPPGILAAIKALRPEFDIDSFKVRKPPVVDIKDEILRGIQDKLSPDEQKKVTGAFIDPNGSGAGKTIGERASALMDKAQANAFQRYNLQSKEVNNMFGEGIPAENRKSYEDFLNEEMNLLVGAEDPALKEKVLQGFYKLNPKYKPVENDKAKQSNYDVGGNSKMPKGFSVVP